jgi:hypothetical protein
MGYQDLGGPTPINYRPDDDSAMLAIGDALKVQKVCNAIKNDRQRNLKEGKRRNKKKKVKKQTGTDVGSDSVVADKAPSDSENLIMVGGIAGYDECFRPHKKTYKQFREEVESILLQRNAGGKGICATCVRYLNQIPSAYANQNLQESKAMKLRVCL